MFALNERLSKIEEKSLIQLPSALSDLKKDLENLSFLKLDVESTKKDLVQAQVDILVNGNNTNTQLISNANRIDNAVSKVDALEKEQINILINENNLTNKVNSSSNRIDQILAKVEVLEKDQRDIVLSQNNLSSQVVSNSNRIDQIVPKLDALEKDQSGILTEANLLTSQFNQISNKIDQLITKVDVLPVLSAKVETLGFDVPTIQDSIQSINLKINSDTFNKVEMFGPYYPNKHTISMTVTNSGYTLFQTVKPCILSVRGKAIVTLIATGISNTNSNYSGQMSFMINRTVDLPFTNSDKWQFGAQFVLANSDIPVNLTQEFMLEKGVYEFALGGYFPYSGSTVIYINALSFVAKVTYIS